MNILTMNNISKTYGIKRLLESISFGIDDGEKIGLLGINGSGKSTLLKLAAGLEEPDEGQVVHGRRLGIQYLPQDPPLESSATVLEAALAAAVPDPTLDMWTLETDARTLLTRLGITDCDQTLSQLSGGQRKRVALAAALMTPAELLILDEPTNHLDNRAIDWLEKYLQRFKGALLMVTHDRYFLERVTQRIIELDDAALFSYSGNYSRYLELKLAREQQAAASADKKHALLRKELAWIKRGARARSTKQKARIERFDKLSSEPVRPMGQSLQISAAASRLGRKTIILHNVSHGYHSDVLIRDFSVTLAREERLGIVGPNGIGKSTLLRILSGEIKPDLGTVETGTTVKIAYFPQESTGLPEDMRILDYIREAGEYLPSDKKMLSAAQMLETFLFPSSTHWTPLRKLSGGEKRRLHLLRILMTAPNVLLLDEPGNNLDIETLTILEDYLDEFPGAVVTVSHDRYFLDRITSRILAFEASGRLAEYSGNYSDYLGLIAGQAPITILNGAEPSREIPTPSYGKSSPKPPKFTFKEQREFSEIDDKIAAAEQALMELEAQINLAAADYQRLEQLTILRSELEHHLEYLLERWIYLNELAEEIDKNTH